jgi:hypothetical protein
LREHDLTTQSALLLPREFLHRAAHLERRLQHKHETTQVNKKPTTRAPNQRDIAKNRLNQIKELATATFAGDIHQFP